MTFGACIISLQDVSYQYAAAIFRNLGNHLYQHIYNNENLHKSKTLDKLDFSFPNHYLSNLFCYNIGSFPKLTIRLKSPFMRHFLKEFKTFEKISEVD